MNAHTPPAHLTAGRSTDEGGMELLLWILIWSEFAVFGAFLVAFLILGLLDPTALATLHGALDLPLAGAATAVLLTSGYFAARAAFGPSPRWNLIAAALGGLGFVALKLVAYSHEIPTITAVESRLVELYFLITGFHLAHVLFVALIMLAIAWRPTPRRTGTIASIWHAIDLVWLLILPVIYLG
jgi:nitric oxide reductase NorE protein